MGIASQAQSSSTGSIPVPADGDRIVILLTVGTKKRQQRDIEDAHDRWND